MDLWWAVAEKDIDRVMIFGFEDIYSCKVKTNNAMLGNAMTCAESADMWWHYS